MSTGEQLPTFRRNAFTFRSNPNLQHHTATPALGPSGVYKRTYPQGRSSKSGVSQQPPLNCGGGDLHCPCSSGDVPVAGRPLYWRNGKVNGGGSMLRSPEALILTAFKLQFVRESQQEGHTQAAYFRRRGHSPLERRSIRPCGSYLVLRILKSSHTNCSVTVNVLQHGRSFQWGH